MSLITVVFLGSTLGILLCLNPFRRRPQHVIIRQEQALKREKMKAQKYSSAGRV
jgi:hypothetical protein